MFTYLATKENFLLDCDHIIENKNTHANFRDIDPIKKMICFLENYIKYKDQDSIDQNRFKISNSQIDAWKDMFTKMKNVFENLSANIGIGMEYIEELSRGNNTLPCRPDLLIGGINGEGQKIILLVEVKGWSNDRTNFANDVFQTIESNRQNPEEQVPYRGIYYNTYPSEQVVDYLKHLKDNNSEVRNGNINIIPVVWMLNLDRDSIRDEYIDKLEHPLYENGYNSYFFYLGDEEEFKSFIENTFDNTENDNCMDVFSLLKSGEPCATYRMYENIKDVLYYSRPDMEHILKLRTDQKRIYDNLIKDIGNWVEQRNQENVNADNNRNCPPKIIYVKGNSGSGKSVISLALLGYIYYNYRNLDCKYICPSGAPVNACRHSMEEGEDFADMINNITVFKEIDRNNWSPDIIILDEGQLCDISTSGFGRLKCSLLICFYDPDQIVRYEEQENGFNNFLNYYAGTVIGCEVDEVEETVNDFMARTNGTKEPHYELASHFRCNQDEGYLTFVKDILYNTHNFLDADYLDFDVKIITGIDDLIYLMDQHTHMFLTAIQNDITLNDNKCVKDYYSHTHGEHYLFDWNNDVQNYYSARYETMRGLEGDNIIVYIREDELRMDDNDTVIGEFKRQYYVLLTRGMKSCYIYCENERLRNHLMNTKKIRSYVRV